MDISWQDEIINSTMILAYDIIILIVVYNSLHEEPAQY